MARVCLVDGHPDPDPARFCHALAAAYAEGAASAGRGVDLLALAGMEVPLLRGRAEWEGGAPPTEDLRRAVEAIEAASHLVLVYPLWLGTVPALLKAFLEQALRPGMAGWPKPLRDKTARIVVTMGMPALVYRWWFGAHSLKGLERNVLRFAGCGTIRETLIGGVEAIGDEKRRGWLEAMRKLGREAR